MALMVSLSAPKFEDDRYRVGAAWVHLEVVYGPVLSFFAAKFLNVRDDVEDKFTDDELILYNEFVALSQTERHCRICLSTFILSGDIINLSLSSANDENITIESRNRLISLSTLNSSRHFLTRSIFTVNSYISRSISSSLGEQKHHNKCLLQLRNAISSPTCISPSKIAHPDCTSPFFSAVYLLSILKGYLQFYNTTAAMTDQTVETYNFDSCGEFHAFITIQPLLHFIIAAAILSNFWSFVPTNDPPRPSSISHTATTLDHDLEVALVVLVQTIASMLHRPRWMRSEFQNSSRATPKT